MAGSDAVAYTTSPWLTRSAGFTMLITLGDSKDGLTCTEGLTGATGMTLLAIADAKSAPAGRTFGVRSKEGNCILFKGLRPSGGFYYMTYVS